MTESWLRTMSASKIAAVVGLSPYDSRFSLWHRMAGHLDEEQPVDPVLLRGHYLEPAILAWFRDQHPDWEITRAGVDGPMPHYWTELPDGRRHPMWAHPDDRRFTASPDGHVRLPDATIETVEIKSASDTTEWGKPGTDEVPVGYKAQVQWQMFVTGTRRTHIAVLGAYLEFAEYVVDYDHADARYLADAARDFLDSLPGGPLEQRPDLDAHAATYEAVRRLHPNIDDRDVELPVDLVREFCESRTAYDEAEARKQAAVSLMADALGDAKRGVYLGKTIASRQAKSGGVPFLKAGRNLPTFQDQESAA